MSAIKNHYHAELTADSYHDDCDWEWFAHCEEQAERELDGAGTTDEPQRDEEFARFEGESEHALRAVVLDLFKIGWTPSRVTAVVAAVAKDAA